MDRIARMLAHAADGVDDVLAAIDHTDDLRFSDDMTDDLMHELEDIVSRLKDLRTDVLAA